MKSKIQKCVHFGLAYTRPECALAEHTNHFVAVSRTLKLLRNFIHFRVAVVLLMLTFIDLSQLLLTADLWSETSFLRVLTDQCIWILCSDNVKDCLERPCDLELKWENYRKVFQRWAIADGDGDEAKPFKTEWATIKDGKLWIGSIGFEWSLRWD